MRYARAWTLAFAVCGTASFATAAVAQQPGTSDRDCQVIRSLQFRARRLYRGCLSSYSCRVCRFVPHPAMSTASASVCQRMRCDWGLLAAVTCGQGSGQQAARTDDASMTANAAS